MVQFFGNDFYALFLKATYQGAGENPGCRKPLLREIMSIARRLVSCHRLLMSDTGPIFRRRCALAERRRNLPALLSHHCNGDARQVDREPRTELRAANRQDNPIRVSQPSDADSCHDGTTDSDRNIVAG